MRTSFITGATQGFGALIVEKALAAGDAVVATARNPKQLIERLGYNPNLLAVPLDVNNEVQVRQAVAAVEQDTAPVAAVGSRAHESAGSRKLRSRMQP